MNVPNGQSVVERLRDQFPDEWKNAHTGNAHTEDFVKRLAWVLHTEVDARFGLCGQYGDPNRIADDVVLWLGDGAGTDKLTGKPQHGYDFIVDAGGANPRPAWNLLNGGGVAAWVKPSPVAGGVAPPAAPSDYWTAAHDAIRVRMAGRSVRELAEQLAHAFPGESWGEKRTSGGSWSADTIGRLVDGRLWAIKVIPSVKVYGFLDASHVHRSAGAVNHLGDVVAPPPPPPPVEPPPVEPPTSTPTADYGPRFDILDANVGELMAMVVRLAAAVDGQRQQVIDAVKGQTYDIDVKAGPLGRVKGTITPQAQP